MKRQVLYMDCQPSKLQNLPVMNLFKNMRISIPNPKVIRMHQKTRSASISMISLITPASISGRVPVSGTRWAGLESVLTQCQMDIAVHTTYIEALNQ